MCAKCYQASDHDGHDVTFRFSASTGGYCDCGDAQAWNRDIKCKLHGVHHELDQDLPVARFDQVRSQITSEYGSSFIDDCGSIKECY